MSNIWYRIKPLSNKTNLSILPFFFNIKSLQYDFWYLFAFIHTCYNWQIRGGNVSISITSVSKLDFCFHTLRLAVGDECGLVRYALSSRYFSRGSKYSWISYVYNHFLLHFGSCRSVFMSSIGVTIRASISLQKLNMKVTL